MGFCGGGSIVNSLKTFGKKISGIVAPKPPLVAVDIGTASIKLIALKAEKKGIPKKPHPARGFGYAGPPEAEQNRQRIESVQYYPLNAETLPTEPGEKQNFIAEQLRDAFTSLKLKNPPITTSISGSSVIVREAKLPALSSSELRKILPTEAEPFIPYNVAEVNLDYHIVGETTQDNQKKYDVILVAAKQDAIEERLDIFVKSQARPIVVDVDAFALTNLSNLLSRNEGQIQTIVIANIGAIITNLVIAEGGEARVVRDVTIAGQTFTKALQSGANINIAKAEEIKIKIGLLPENPNEEDAKALALLEAIARELFAEIHKSIDFYLTRGTERTIHKIYLTGGGSLLKNLALFASNELKIPVEILNPFDLFTLPENQQALYDIGPTFSVACGLALRQWEDWKA